ncbi:SAP domain-containing protein [Companilactobacillus formosensis]|uniref:SAP domain-containing protein n=1 Tax=Companilactobacillus formosensis TaxID=1617889 RepID=UPI000E6486D0|nr:SAP domain-containing protein [Companilactobacillus formosensis]
MLNFGEIYALSILDGKREDYYFNSHVLRNVFLVSETNIAADLVKQGLLTLTFERELSLSNFYVDQLKEILFKHNLSTTGRKAILINRIIENLDVEEINQIIKTKTFLLTDAGQKLLDNNPIVHFITENYCDNVITFKTAKMAGIPNNQDDPIIIIDQITDFLIEKYTLEKRYQKLFEVLNHRFFSKLKYNLDQTDFLDTCLKLIYLSLSGQALNVNNSPLSDLKQHIESLDDLKSKIAIFPMNYINKLIRFQAGNGVSDDSLLLQFHCILDEYKQIDSLFSDVEMVTLLKAGLTYNYEAIDKTVVR